MLKVGITGGMGSGKSMVTKMFSLLGIAIYIADDEAKKLMESDSALRQQISALFGEQAYVADKLNRSFIAQNAFSNPHLLEKLNAIVHPAVITHGEQWMQGQSGPYAIKEAALFFESGSDKQMDVMIGVWCPEKIRIQRILKRDGISIEMAKARIGKQMNEEEKMKRCHFVINNDGTHAIIPQVLHLHQILLHKTSLFPKQ